MGGADCLRREMGCASLPQQEGKRQESAQDSDFQPGEKVLDFAGETHSNDVDNREYRNHTYRQQVPVAGVNPLRGKRQSRCRAWRQRRVEVRQILRKEQGRGGDGRRKTREERNPAAQEPPRRSPGLAQINVLASRSGKINGQLGVTETPRQGDHRARQPDAKH